MPDKKRKSNGKFKKAVARAHELSLAGRPPLSDRALGTPDPRFSGGLGGLIETDPGSFAKGMAALPFTIPPDLLSLLSQGDMFPARKNPFAALSQGGEPIREAIGADNFVGRTGEFLFPAGGAAKLAAAVPLLMKTGKAEALLGRFVTTTPGRIRNVTEREGGYLVNLRSGDVPEEGLAVAKFGGEKSRAVQLRGSITKNELEKFTEQNRAQLDNVNLYLGTWMERDTGITYLDMSKVFRTDEMRAATKFGEKSGQTSGFRIGMGEEFPIGSWDEFLNSKEFSQRMSQMEKVGQDYLARQPTAEWWDVHGTVFEAVYGKENLRVMAGFMASTSPNTNPQQNLRFMTEYMRRHLIGEDIVQPAWRIPETGTINRTPGVQIGMEAPRSPNLLRSAAGDI